MEVESGEPIRSTVFRPKRHLGNRTISGVQTFPELVVNRWFATIHPSYEIANIPHDIRKTRGSVRCKRDYHCDNTRRTFRTWKDRRYSLCTCSLSWLTKKPPSRIPGGES